MTKSVLVRYLATTLAICAVGLGACAQQGHTPATSDYKPRVGQEGRDVVWVPTPQVLVDQMLDLAKVTPKDYVIDLGSGDGRTVIAAAQRGARALGIEFNPDMVELSRRNAEQAGVADRARFARQDLFRADLSKATVITMFLLESINLKLRPKLLDLAPGTRIVSNSFTMGDWEADETVTLDMNTGCGAWCTALLWIVPAQVAGTHKTSQGELALAQTYQMLSGTLRADGKAVPVKGRVIGDKIILDAGGRALRGRIVGNRLELQ